MKTYKKKTILKPSAFPLIQLLGSDEEKIQMYQDFRCPNTLLSDAFEEWKDNSTERGVKFKIALAENPNLTSTQVFFLSQDKDFNVSNLASQNIQHPTFQKKIIENFHKMCWNYLSQVVNKDIYIMESLKNGAFLTGGSLGTLIRQNSKTNNRRERIGVMYGATTQGSDSIKDWDFYFTNESDLLKVMNHFLNNMVELPSSDTNHTSIPENLQLHKTEHGFDLPQLKGKGVIWANYKPNMKHQIILSNNALTIKNPGFSDFQFVFKVCKPKAEEVVATFDFAHCQGILFPSGDLQISPKTYASIMEKRLFFEGGLNPINSIIRLFKLTAKKQWTIDRIELLKMMAFASQKIDFTSPKDIKEHLQGFYFETSYPELFKYPDDKVLTIAELFDWLDGNL